MTLPSRANWVILGLLACNTLYYVFAGRPSEALDSVAWYVLLILFTLESRDGPRRFSARALTAMRVARAGATMAIAASAVLYVREKEWLDAANLLLWIAVVALLEIELLKPAAVAAHRRAFTRGATLLYAGLGALVLMWLARGEWMNTWDAALWLAAFGLLELKLLSAAEDV